MSKVRKGYVRELKEGDMICELVSHDKLIELICDAVPKNVNIDFHNLSWARIGNVVYFLNDKNKIEKEVYDEK